MHAQILVAFVLRVKLWIVETTKKKKSVVGMDILGMLGRLVVLKQEIRCSRSPSLTVPTTKC